MTIKKSFILTVFICICIALSGCSVINDFMSSDTTEPIPEEPTLENRVDITKYMNTEWVYLDNNSYLKMLAPGAENSFIWYDSFYELDNNYIQGDLDIYQGEEIITSVISENKELNISLDTVKKIANNDLENCALIIVSDLKSKSDKGLETPHKRQYVYIHKNSTDGNLHLIDVYTNTESVFVPFEKAIVQLEEQKAEELENQKPKLKNLSYTKIAVFNPRDNINEIVDGFEYVYNLFLSYKLNLEKIDSEDWKNNLPENITEKDIELFALENTQKIINTSKVEFIDNKECLYYSTQSEFEKNLCNKYGIKDEDIPIKCKYELIGDTLKLYPGYENKDKQLIYDTNPILSLTKDGNNWMTYNIILDNYEDKSLNDVLSRKIIFEVFN